MFQRDRLHAGPAFLLPAIGDPGISCRILFELIALHHQKIGRVACRGPSPSNRVAERAIPPLAKVIPTEEAYLITKQGIMMLKSDNKRDADGENFLGFLLFLST